MEKPDRRIIWLHVTFFVSGDIEITFVIERWRHGRYIGKRRTTCIISRIEWGRLGKIMSLARSHPDVKYVLPAYDGWSVCFETLY